MAWHPAMFGWIGYGKEFIDCNRQLWNQGNPKLFELPLQFWLELIFLAFRFALQLINLKWSTFSCAMTYITWAFKKSKGQSEFQ